MKTKTVITLLLLLTTPIYSTPKPTKRDATQLVKVTPKNQAQCIEYFTVQNTLFCSTKPLLNTQIAKEITDAETFQLNLDNNQWRIAASSITPTITMIEYVQHGDTLQTWQELITTQFFPGYPATITPKMIALTFINSLQQQGLSPSITIYAENKDEIIFEWQIFSPIEQVQNEIQRIIKSPKGTHILHYTRKKSDINASQHEQWLKFIAAVPLKP